jgi:hypothetical protein
MSNKYKSDERETDHSKYTQIKTVYARATIILLVVNFCLTGYVLTGVIKMKKESGVSAVAQTPPPSVSFAKEIANHIEEHRLAHHPEEPAQWVKEYMLTVEQIKDPAILAQLRAIRELMSEYVEKQNEILRKKHEDFLRYGDRPELPSKK